MEAGLKVRVQIDSNLDPAGLKICDQQAASLTLESDSFHGEGNDKISLRVAAMKVP